MDSTRCRKEYFVPTREEVSTSHTRRFAFRSLFPLSGLPMVLIGALMVTANVLAETPGVGAKAPDFTLSTPTGTSVQLGEQEMNGTVVLVVLRGFPGYQCPYCQKQAHDFAEHASEFAAKKASVLLVYPGPPAELDQRAKEFLEKQADLPANVQLVTDPDYKVTNLYGLRWDAPHETAYPSTFILDKQGKILFEKISHSHGDRTSASDMLAQIP
jgi:peroxiredoxin